MKSALATIVIAGLIGANSAICLGQRKHRGSEQRVFGAEDESFKRPFALPEVILNILSKDPEIPDTFGENDTPRPKQVPNSWFFASIVHLAGPDEQDVVVMGRCPVCGANVAPFWVFRPTRDGYEQLMFGGGLALELMKSRTNGFRDLETSYVSTQKLWTDVWRFDGQKYQRVPGKKSNSE